MSLQQYVRQLRPITESHISHVDRVQKYFDESVAKLPQDKELDELNQIAVKQLKNRYNDLTVNKRFVIGIDRAKMRLFDVKVSEQDNIVDSGQEDFEEPVFDTTDFGGFKV